MKGCIIIKEEVPAVCLNPFPFFCFFFYIYNAQFIRFNNLEKRPTTRRRALTLRESKKTKKKRQEKCGSISFHRRDFQYLFSQKDKIIFCVKDSYEFLRVLKNFQSWL